MTNNKFIHNVIWGIAGTLFIGIVTTAASIMWSTNTMSAQIKNNADYSQENRRFIEKNTMAIDEIAKNGRTLTKIATSMRYIEKSGDDRNDLLKKVVARSEKTALEQASRTSAIKSIRDHVNSSGNHRDK